MNRKRSTRSAFAWEEGGRVWRVSWDVSEEFSYRRESASVRLPKGSIFPPMVEYGSEDRGRNAGIALRLKFLHSSCSSSQATELARCGIARMDLEDG